MTDEKYTYIQDCKDKKNTARSARYKRTHNGKGGSVKLPSDYMTVKELKNMNGECKSYKMNSPITWDEFKTWPDEHKITYIKLLRAKYSVPDGILADALGVSRTVFGNYIRCLNLGLGKGAGAAGRRWNESDLKDQFFAWWNGVKLGEKSMEEEVEPVEPAESAKEATDEMVVEVPNIYAGITYKDLMKVPTHKNMPVDVQELKKDLKEFADECDRDEKKRFPHGGSYEIPHLVIGKAATPIKGEMTFEGNVDDILRTIKNFLGGQKARIKIEWRTYEPDPEPLRD